MPFMPNVPHIVGDDDDLSDADDTAQILDAKTHSSAVAASSTPERKTTDNMYASSDPSESSYDNESEANEESNSSTAEEEDWSNNISYIVRTPEREPPEQVDVKTSLNSTITLEVNFTQDMASVENGQTIDLTDDFQPENVKKSEQLATNQCSSPMKVKPNMHSSNSTPDPPHMSECACRDFEAEEMHTCPAEQLNDSAVPELNASNSVDDLSMPTRRQSLRSAHRTVPIKSAAPPAKRVRPRKSKISNDDASPTVTPTIAARVIKRPRLSLSLNKSPVGRKPPVLLARPVEVTEYFTNISATLVSQRVNLLPFLYMRKRIDRLVGEAIAKTKMDRENNPIL